VGSLMPQPGIKPDSEQMENLIKLCTDKEEPVRVITAEPQYGDKVAKFLLAAVKEELNKKKLSQDFAPTLATFDTMETTAAPEFPDDLYFIKMRENIDNLAKALK
jgi:zinc/manganese transport system substrate-binding protein/zinc transport system substrate-binding protein